MCRCHSSERRACPPIPCPSCTGTRCGHGLLKTCLFDGLRSHPPVAQGGPTRWSVSLGQVSTHDPVANALLASLAADGHVHSVTRAGDDEGRVAVGLSGATDEAGGALHAEGPARTSAHWVAVAAEALENATVVNVAAELARRGGSPHPLVYDTVVRCLGWRHGTGMYVATRCQCRPQPPFCSLETLIRACSVQLGGTHPAPAVCTCAARRPVYLPLLRRRRPPCATRWHAPLRAHAVMLGTTTQTRCRRCSTTGSTRS